MVSPGPPSRPLLIHPSALSPIEYEAYSIVVNLNHDHRPGRFKEQKQEQEQHGVHQRSRPLKTTKSTPSGVWQELKRWITVDVDPKVEKQILSFYREPSAIQNESSDQESAADLHLMLGMLRLWSHSSTNRFLTRDLAFIQNDEPTHLFVPPPHPPPPTATSPVEHVSSPTPTSPAVATTSSNPFRVASPSPPPHSTVLARGAPNLTERDKNQTPIASTSRGPPPALPAKRIVSEPVVAPPKRETNPFRSSASTSGPATTTVSPRAVSDPPKDAAISSNIPFPPSLPPRKAAAVPPVEPPPRRVSLKKSADPSSKSRVLSSSLTHRPGGPPPVPPPSHRASSSAPNTHSARTSRISTSGYNPLSDSASPVEPLIKTRSSSSSSKLTSSTHIGLETSVRLLSTPDESPNRAVTRMARSNSAVSNASSTTSNPDVVGTYDGGIVYERPFSRKISLKFPYVASRGMGMTPKDAAAEGMEIEASGSSDDDDDDDRAMVLTDPLPTRSTFEGFSRGETIRPDQRRPVGMTNQAPLQPPPRRVVTAPIICPFGNEPFFDDDDEDAQIGWGHAPGPLSGSNLSRSATHSGAPTSRRRSELAKGGVRLIPQRASSLSFGVQGRKGLGGAVEGHDSWTQAAKDGEEWMNRAKEGIVRRTSRGIALIATTVAGPSSRERGERLIGVGDGSDDDDEGVFRDEPGRVVASEKDEEEDSDDDDDDDGGRVEPEPPERVKRKTAQEVRREVEREVKKSQQGAEWNKI